MSRSTSPTAAVTSVGLACFLRGTKGEPTSCGVATPVGRRRLTGAALRQRPPLCESLSPRPNTQSHPSAERMPRIALCTDVWYVWRQVFILCIAAPSNHELTYNGCPPKDGQPSFRPQSRSTANAVSIRGIRQYASRRWSDN